VSFYQSTLAFAGVIQSFPSSRLGLGRQWPKTIHHKRTRPKKIAKFIGQPDYTLKITTTKGHEGVVDATPYLKLEAFEALQNADNFMYVLNGSCFIELDCGADLSAIQLKLNGSVLMVPCEQATLIASFDCSKSVNPACKP
jgi:hypothetical protein